LPRAARATNSAQDDSVDTLKAKIHFPTEINMEKGVPVSTPFPPLTFTSLTTLLQSLNLAGRRKTRFCGWKQSPGAEAQLILRDLTARVNSCPSQNRLEAGFFSSLNLVVASATGMSAATGGVSGSGRGMSG
jgi:hypothetical protein